MGNPRIKYVEPKKGVFKFAYYSRQYDWQGGFVGGVMFFRNVTLCYAENTVPREVIFVPDFQIMLYLFLLEIAIIRQFVSRTTLMSLHYYNEFFREDGGNFLF